MHLDVLWAEPMLGTSHKRHLRSYISLENFKLDELNWIHVNNALVSSSEWKAVCVCVLQHSVLPCRHPICQFTEFQYTYLFGYLAMCVYQRSGILLAVEFSTANEELYHWIFRFILLIANNYNIFFCCCLSFLYFRLHVLIISSNFSIRHLTIFERNACHNAIVEQIMRKLLATSISGLLECTDFCVKRCESAIFYWYTTISCGKVRAVILERRTALVFSIKFAADKKISKECKTHSCCTKYVDNKT